MDKEGLSTPVGRAMHAYIIYRPQRTITLSMMSFQMVTYRIFIFEL